MDPPLVAMNDLVYRSKNTEIFVGDPEDLGAQI